MDNQMTNTDRSLLAWTAVQTFHAAKGDLVGDVEIDAETAIVDLVADLAHLCDERGVDFAGAIGRGLDHYAYEVAERERRATP